MRSTAAMEHLISEAVQTFSEKIPGSEDWLKKIDIILVSERSRTKQRNAAFTKVDAPLNEDIPTTEGETIAGRKGIVILLYTKHLSISSIFKWIVWHELGHACTLVHTRDLYEEAEACVQRRDYTDLAVGYAVWSEFAADCIANLVASPEELPYTVDTVEANLIHLTKMITAESMITPALLGHYCATYLSEPANEFMENAPEHDCGVSLFSFRQRQVLPDLYDVLIDQLSEDSFWVISRETLEALGQAMNRVWAAN